MLRPRCSARDQYQWQHSISPSRPPEFLPQMCTAPPSHPAPPTLLVAFRSTPHRASYAGPNSSPPQLCARPILPAHTTARSPPTPAALRRQYPPTPSKVYPLPQLSLPTSPLQRAAQLSRNPQSRFLPAKLGPHQPQPPLQLLTQQALLLQQVSPLPALQPESQPHPPPKCQCSLLPPAFSSWPLMPLAACFPDSEFRFP